MQLVDFSLRKRVKRHIAVLEVLVDFRDLFLVARNAIEGFAPNLRDVPRGGMGEQQLNAGAIGNRLAGDAFIYARNDILVPLLLKVAVKGVQLVGTGASLLVGRVAGVDRNSGSFVRHYRKSFKGVDGPLFLSYLEGDRGKFAHSLTWVYSVVMFCSTSNMELNMKPKPRLSFFVACMRREPRVAGLRLVWS